MPLSHFWLPLFSHNGMGQLLVWSPRMPGLRLDMKASNDLTDRSLEYNTCRNNHHAAMSYQLDDWELPYSDHISWYNTMSIIVRRGGTLYAPEWPCFLLVLAFRPAGVPACTLITLYTILIHCRMKACIITCSLSLLSCWLNAISLWC